jgi:phosphopantothenoylcysteine decarboxylase/phosphopantothenate--cysteine ligase
MNKKILLIITGSIACYKSIDLIRLLKKKSYEVNCILTKGAQEFITPLLVSSISSTKTYHQLFSSDDELQMGHINLSRTNDLIIIAPTTADFINKMANGHGDDLALSTILASDKKIMFAPAMNEKMWKNEITQKNVKSLTDKGFIMLEPEQDILACGENGIGKMIAPEKIVHAIDDFFVNQDLLANKNILITLGGTIEPIDAVRYISNNSSGKQGLAIAKILSEMGANIYLVCGNISQSINFSVKSICAVQTAEQMLEACKNILNNPARLDAFISCGAVCDYKVKNYSSQKIRKSQNPQLTLTLEQNPDILQTIAKSSLRPKIVVGFCADQGEELLDIAKQKLIDKNCDLMIANNIKNGEIFGNDFTEGYIIDNQSFEQYNDILKIDFAKKIADKIVKLFSSSKTTPPKF